MAIKSENQYSTLHGDQSVIYSLNQDREIFDIGLYLEWLYDLDEFEQVVNILSRKIWASYLGDPQLMGLLWFSGTENVSLNYENRIGTADELIATFIAGYSVNNAVPEVKTVEANEGLFTIGFGTEEELLTLQFSPNLYLYLNGQPDVVYQSIKAHLSGTRSADQVSRIHPYHQFSNSDDSFRVTFTTIERELRQIEFEKGAYGWTLKGESEGFGYENKR
jgi:hypothetical protein